MKRSVRCPEASKARRVPLGLHSPSDPRGGPTLGSGCNDTKLSLSPMGSYGRKMSQSFV